MNRRTKQGLMHILTLICLAVFLFSAWKLVDIFQDYKEAEDFYDHTAGSYVSETEDTEPSDPQLPKEKPPIEVDFSELVDINEDVFAWIYMEDTVVNYPVLQGENNLYYLDKTYWKKYLASGSIYLDSDNERDMSDAHSIIYGHNMKNHTMFGDLSDFRDAEYLKEHPYVDLFLVDGTWLRYEIFSLYRAHVDDGTFRAPLNKASNFEPFLDLVTEQNMHADADLELPEILAGDKVLTLSTCTEDSSDTDRFVVHAVLVSRDGLPVRESTSEEWEEETTE